MLQMLEMSKIRKLLTTIQPRIPFFRLCRSLRHYYYRRQRRASKFSSA